ncbi:hypothetical protein KBB48_03350, partial [Candidatus Shapirobacteria bacterium]|nr:hypothetical protein [Candidatus Shapirobacteria bacterium]
MTRSNDLDLVAPDDVIENKMEETRNEKLETPTDTVKTANLKEKIYGIVGHTKHPLSSLLVNPHVFNFEEKDDAEKIILLARPHW